MTFFFLPTILYLFGAVTAPVAGTLGLRARSAYVSGIALFALLIAVASYPAALAGETYWVGDWIPAGSTAYGISLSIDALSWVFLLVITLIGLAVTIYSHSYPMGEADRSKYYLLLGLLLAAMTGIVLASDLFNLFVFLEIAVLSAVGLVAFRGEKAALDGAFNYLVLITVGTSFVLLAVILLYAATGTLNMAQIAAKIADAPLRDNLAVYAALGLFFVGFSLEAAFMPLHNWLPDAHSGAPSPVSALLSGVFVKIGLYALLRILFSVYGLSGASNLLVIIGIVSMVGGVLLAFIQTDFKRLLAYHTVSQLGYVVLAIGLGTPIGIAAGLFHMLNHAIFKALLFFTAGAIIRKLDTRNLNEMGGLAKKMPLTTLAFTVGALAISGVPPFNGFASKWLIYNATFASNPVITGLALLTSALTLASFFKVFHGAFLGATPKKYEGLTDVPLSMAAPMLALAALCLIIGLFPFETLNIVIYPALSAVNALGPIALFGYWDALLWSGVFAAIVAALWLAFGLRSRSRTGTAFTCGEPLETRTPVTHFYSAFHEALAPIFRALESYQTGSVNDYASYVIIFTAIVAAVLAVGSASWLI